MTDPDFLRRLERELVDKGKLIEAGWVSLRIAAIPMGRGERPAKEMKLAFFAEAQHLFGSIMGLLEEGDEATEADLRRLDLINDELQIFVAEFERKHGLGGRAN